MFLNTCIDRCLSLCPCTQGARALKERHPVATRVTLITVTSLALGTIGMIGFLLLVTCTPPIGEYTFTVGAILTCSYWILGWTSGMLLLLGGMFVPIIAIVTAIFMKCRGTTQRQKGDTVFP